MWGWPGVADSEVQSAWWNWLLHGGDPHPTEPGPTIHRCFSKELILLGAAGPGLQPLGPAEPLALAETWDQSHGWQCLGQAGSRLALGDVC